MGLKTNEGESLTQEVIHFGPNPVADSVIGEWIDHIENEEDPSMGQEGVGYALRRYRQNPKWNHLLVAVENEQIVGATIIDGNPHVRRRCLFFLGSIHEKRGIGTALVESAVSVIPKDCMVFCEPIGDSGPFYQHLGFVPNEDGQWDLQEDALSQLRSNHQTRRHWQFREGLKSPPGHTL